MSGTTVILGYIPDGVTLVPPNSPITVLTGPDAAVDAAVAGAIAGLAGEYVSPMMVQTFTSGQKTQGRTNVDAAQSSATGARAVGQNEQRINVTYFRIAGDGSTRTDTQMIVAAEAYRATLTKPGAELYFPASGGTGSDGAYMVTPGVTLGSTCGGLVGDGRGRSIIRVVNSAGDYFSVFGYSSSGGTYFSARGITFDGNSANNAVTGSISANPRIMLHTNPGSKIAIVDNEFANCNGVWTVYVSPGASQASTDLDVCGNLFTNIGANSIAIDTSTIYFVGNRCTIAHNTLVGGGLGAKTAMEIHGNDQKVHHNTVTNFFKIGNACGLEVSGVAAYWHHNIGHGLCLGITLYSGTTAGLANTTPWGFEHVDITDNYLELDYDRWVSAYPSIHRSGVSYTDGPTPLGLRNVSIRNNTVRCITYTSVPNATDALSAGILLSRSSAYSGYDETVEITGNRVFGPYAAGVHIAMNNTATKRLKIADNVVTNPASGGTANFGTTAYATGVFINGAFTDLRINRNEVFDDRGTHVTNSGVDIQTVSSVSNTGRALDNVVSITDGSYVPVILGSTTSGTALFARHRQLSYVTPTGKFAAGSEITDQAGTIRVQTDATTGGGSTWTALPTTSPVIAYAFKTADTVINNTTTKAADPDLTLAVASSSKYIVEVYLAYDASTAADLSVQWSAPSGALMPNWIVEAVTTGATGGTSAMSRTTNATVTSVSNIGGVAVGTIVEAHIMGLLTTTSTAGSLTLTWAQFVADATNATVRAGSWMRLTKVA